MYFTNGASSGSVIRSFHLLKASGIWVGGKKARPPTMSIFFLIDSSNGLSKRYQKDGVLGIILKYKTNCTLVQVSNPLIFDEMTAWDGNNSRCISCLEKLVSMHSMAQVRSPVQNVQFWVQKLPLKYNTVNYGSGNPSFTFDRVKEKKIIFLRFTGHQCE